MSEYSRASLASIVLLFFIYLTMSFALGFILDDNVAGFLAATNVWSLPVFICAQTIYPIRLPYRYGLLMGANYALSMIILKAASLIVGVKLHLFLPIVATLLLLPALAIAMLLERTLFTAEERMEIKSLRLRKYQTP